MNLDPELLVSSGVIAPFVVGIASGVSIGAMCWFAGWKIGVIYRIVRVAADAS